MIKSGIALALVAALVGVATANKIDELEIEQIGGHGGFHRGGFGPGPVCGGCHGLGGLGGGLGSGIGGGLGGLSSFEDEILFEELLRRGHHLGHLGGRGGYGRGRGRGGLGRRGGFGSGIGKGIPLGHGPVVGGGALGGGLIGSQSAGGALGAHSHNHQSNLAEGAKGGIIAGSKSFDVGQHHDIHSDNAGLHKHQVINNDKTIIKDRTTGVNDVDAFRNSNGINEGSHLGAQESGLAAGFGAGRLENERDSDRSIGAIGAERSELAAGAGAIGGGALL